MATIKVIYRGSSQATREGSLFYRIIHMRKVRQVHTGLKIKRSEWNEENGRIAIDENTALSDFLKSMQCKLDAGLKRFAQIISSLDKFGKEYSVDDIVETFQAPEAVVGFISFARKLIAELKQMDKNRISYHYSAALNRFIRCIGKEEVAFDDFDAPLIENYECKLKAQGLCPNSTSYYMRNLRAIYNKAVEQGLTEQRNPFKRVYTGIAKTVKRAVPLGIVKALRDMDLRHDPAAGQARDLFLFSFYTRGMAIIDVAFLRKSDLKNGNLIYRRQKTGQQLTIKWEAPMQEILNRHTVKDSDFMFPLIDPKKPDYYGQYRKAYNKLLRRLRKIGETLGLPEPLTFHRSRHSWASIARDNNVPISVISEGMGHDSEKTTRIYLASLASSVVDEANSLILHLLD